jgi:hemolysin activation/secretion protein
VKLPKLAGLFLLGGVSLLSAQETGPERSYHVERFNLSYAQANPALPDLAQLGPIVIPLESRDGRFIGPGQGGSLSSIRLNEAFAPGSVFGESALRQIFSEIVREYNRRGVFGVFVAPSRDEIDPATKEDRRKPDNRALSLVIWVSEITKVRAVAKGARFAADTAGSDAAHTQILEYSPLKSGQPGGAGSLLEMGPLNDYLEHLNRQPGRNVEATVSPGDRPGEVTLDYLVNENIPWFVYAQVSNTGNDATGQWRERLGAVDDQLFNRDDIASIDYATSGFDRSNAVFASYDYPLIFPDKLRIKAYGSYGNFNAFLPDAGSGTLSATLSGNSWTGGVDLTGTVLEAEHFFADVTAGITSEHYVAGNETAELNGSTDLLTAHFYVTVERHTQVFTFSASVGDEVGLNDVPEDQLVALGRIGTTSKYQLLRGTLNASTYLEPIFYGISGANSWQRSTLAHEVSFTISASAVTGNDRVIPEKEQVIGGLFSVRGYPESFVGGDNAVTASLEYRFHIPKALRPSSVKEGGSGAQPGAREPPPTLFGQPFNWRPPRAYAQPDWDLIARTFLDYGHTTINLGNLQTAQPGDNSATLLSAGEGLELQLRRNFNVRADWGVVLNPVHTGLNGTYQPGDPKVGSSRFSVIATYLL